MRCSAGPFDVRLCVILRLSVCIIGFAATYVSARLSWHVCALRMDQILRDFCVWESFTPVSISRRCAALYSLLLDHIYAAKGLYTRRPAATDGWGSGASRGGVVKVLFSARFVARACATACVPRAMRTVFCAATLATVAAETRIRSVPASPKPSAFFAAFATRVNDVPEGLLRLRCNE